MRHSIKDPDGNGPTTQVSLSSLLGHHVDISALLFALGTALARLWGSKKVID